MENKIKLLYEELKNVRKSIIKLEIKRRTGDILVSKLRVANIIHEKYEEFCKEFSQSKKLDENEVKSIHKYCELFLNLFTDVVSLCTETTMAEEFELKIAMSLLPVMTDLESNTKELINGIEYYDSILEKAACKQKLINFVLKGRLSPSAKLRLNASYATVASLLKDMREQLLPKKAATAIQNKLQQTRQNDKTVSDYGKEISELMVDLTISQANGDPDSYRVLKPLNEKMAIKRFADGLRNRRISTIIAARDYASLKDAVQAAQDEEVATSSTSGEILNMNKPNYRFQRGGHRYHGRSQTRGNPRGHRAVWHNTSYYGQPRAEYNWPRGAGPSSQRGGRGRGRASGKYNNYFPRNKYDRNRHNVNVFTQNPNNMLAQNPNTQAPRAENNTESNANLFFRD